MTNEKTAITKNQIEGLGLELICQNKQKFFVFVDAGGGIKRSGTGQMTDENSDLYIGITKDPIFSALRSTLNDSILESLGQEFNLPFDSRSDIPCKLKIFVKVGDKVQQIVIDYGYRSGLPIEISSFIKAALEITEPWYRGQRQNKPA